MKNGKVTTTLNPVLQHFPGIIRPGDVKLSDDLLNDLAPTVGNGNIKIGPVTKDGRVGIKLAIEASKEACDNTTIKISIEVEIYWNIGGLPLEAPELVQITDDIKDVQDQYELQLDPEFVRKLGLVITVSGLVVFGAAAVATAPITGGQSAMAGFLIISAVATQLKE